MFPFFIWRLPDPISHAVVGLVRPLELHDVVADCLGFPGANIADLAVVVVVPALAGNGIRNRLAELVRGGGSQCFEHSQPSDAPLAAGIRHHGIKSLPPNIIVVPAERLAGGAATLDYLHPGWKEYEVKRIRTGLRYCRVVGNLLLNKLLDCTVLDRMLQRWRGNRNASTSCTAGDLLSGDTVFGQLVHQRASQNEIKELVDARHEVTLR